MIKPSGVLLAILWTLLAALPVPGQVSSVAVANWEQISDGTATGSYLDTHVADGVYETLREKESGGKQSNRTSLLRARWKFNVTAGDSAALFIKGYHDPNSEGDDFYFAWSLERDLNYRTALTVTATSDDGSYLSAFLLPPDLSGDLYIAVFDEDRTAGNRSLDALYIDHMYVETILGGPPAPPGALVASAQPEGNMQLQWHDHSANNDGFVLDRSFDGNSWIQAAVLPPDVGLELNPDWPNTRTYVDTGLPPDTTVYYRVLAFNGEGPSAWSASASATTRPLVAYQSELVLESYPGALGLDQSGVPMIAFANGTAQLATRLSPGVWDFDPIEAGESHVDLAVAPNGGPGMVYVLSTPGKGWRRNYYLRFAERVGSSWIPVEVSPWHSGYSDDLSLAYDSTSSPVIAHSNAYSGFEYFQRFAGTWSEQIVDPDTEEVAAVSIAVDAFGHPAVAYRGTNDDDYVKYARRNGSLADPAASWSIETVALGGDLGLDSVSLAFNPITGRPGIAFTRQDIEPPLTTVLDEIRLAEWDGSDWQVEVLRSISPDDGHLHPDAKLCYDSAGTAYVAYGESDSLSSQIYVMRREAGVWFRELVEDDDNVWRIYDIAVVIPGSPAVIYRGREDGVTGTKFAYK